MLRKLLGSIPDDSHGYKTTLLPKHAILQKQNTLKYVSKGVAWIQTIKFWIDKKLDRLFSDRFVQFKTVIDFLTSIDMKGVGVGGGGLQCWGLGQKL